MDSEQLHHHKQGQSPRPPPGQVVVTMPARVTPQTDSAAAPVVVHAMPPAMARATALTLAPAVAPARAAPNPPAINPATYQYQLNAQGFPTRLVFASIADARKHRNRVTREPELNPLTDKTIGEVEAKAPYYVWRMVQAVFDTSVAKDQPQSTARERCTLTHQKAFPGTDVEVACYELLEKILDRCRNGFRGRSRDNRNLPGAIHRQGKDMKATCKQRVDNVITCLRRWKVSCDDIMTDPYRMEMLANHPLATMEVKAANQRANGSKKKKIEEGNEALEQLNSNREKGKAARPSTRQKAWTGGTPANRPPLAASQVAAPVSPVQPVPLAALAAIPNDQPPNVPPAAPPVALPAPSPVAVASNPPSIVLNGQTPPQLRNSARSPAENGTGQALPLVEQSNPNKPDETQFSAQILGMAQFYNASMAQQPTTHPQGGGYWDPYQHPLNSAPPHPLYAALSNGQDPWQNLPRHIPIPVRAPNQANPRQAYINRPLTMVDPQNAPGYYQPWCQTPATAQSPSAAQPGPSYQILDFEQFPPPVLTRNTVQPCRAHNDPQTSVNRSGTPRTATSTPRVSPPQPPQTRLVNANRPSCTHPPQVAAPRRGTTPSNPQLGAPKPRSARSDLQFMAPNAGAIDCNHQIGIDYSAYMHPDAVPVDPALYDHAQASETVHEDYTSQYLEDYVADANLPSRPVGSKRKLFEDDEPPLPKLRRLDYDPHVADY